MYDGYILFLKCPAFYIAVEIIRRKPVAYIEVRESVTIHISKRSALTGMVFVKSPIQAVIRKQTPAISNKQPVGMMFIGNEQIEVSVQIYIGPECTIPV